MVGAGAARTDLQTNDTHFLLRALVFFFFFFSLNHAPASARFICNFFALIIFFSFLASDYADSALCISDTKLMGGGGEENWSDTVSQQFCYSGGGFIICWWDVSATLVAFTARGVLSCVLQSPLVVLSFYQRLHKLKKTNKKKVTTVIQHW